MGSLAVAALCLAAYIASGSQNLGSGVRAPVAGRTSFRTAPTTLCSRPKMSSIQSRRPGLDVRAMPIEEQEEKAKDMIKYYRYKGLQRTEVNKQVFGWTPNNEILNGRWVMMGMALGLLTEYATGVNFIGQVKLMLSYMG